MVLRVSGRIGTEDVETLTGLLRHEKSGVAIDLKEVTLVDRDAVTFLALSQTNGIELSNCPAYIREWIDRESAHTSAELPGLEAGASEDIEDV